MSITRRSRRETALVLAFVVLLAAGGAWWRWSVRCAAGIEGMPCDYLIVPAPGPLPADQGVGRGAYVYASSPRSPDALGYCYRCLVTTDGHRYRLRGRSTAGDIEERLSPDGRWLSEPGEGADTVVRDLTGTTVYPLAGMSVEGWSGNGRYVLAAGYGHEGDPSRRYVRLDLRSGDRVEYVMPTAVSVLGVRDTGALLLTDESARPVASAGARTTVRVVDPETGNELRRHNLDLSGGLDLSGAAAPVEPLRSLLVSADGHRATAVSRCFLCTGPDDAVVLLVDLDTGHLVRRTDLPRELTTVRLVPEGALVQANGAVLLLDPATGRRRVVARVRAGSYLMPRGVNVD